jgi:hypothetical protein
VEPRLSPEQALHDLPPAIRRDLLRVLSAPENVRADAIRQFFERPDGRSLAETLIDLETDELLRLRVVAILEGLDRG